MSARFRPIAVSRPSEIPQLNQPFKDVLELHPRRSKRLKTFLLGVSSEVCLFRPQDSVRIPSDAYLGPKLPLRSKGGFGGRAESVSAAA